jgi:hypothetical protein
MAKINKSQLLRALSAAEKGRPVRPNPFQAQFSSPHRRVSNQRELERLFASAFAKAGLDIKK